MNFFKIKQKNFFRTRILFIRAVIIFFATLLLFDPIFSENSIFLPILAILCSFCGLITHPLGNFMKLWFKHFVFILGAPVCLLSVEILNNTNPFEALSVTQCIFNLIWYYIIFFIVHIIIGKMKISCVLSTLFFLFIGIINHYVLNFRGRTIFPCDLIAWKTALNVSENFDFTPTKTTISGCLFAFFYIILVLCLPSNDQLKRPNKKITFSLVSICILYMFLFFKTDMMRELGIYCQQWKTQANGFVLNFTVSLKYSMVEKPLGYCETTVLKALENTPEIKPDKNQQPVHIIAIMNESFADFSEFYIPFSSDPTPFLHSLKENTIKGVMYSPVTGGGTANAEFEFLTGNSISFLPPNSVAYQLYIKDKIPSLVSQLKNLGYECIAYHPYKSSGWNRPIVYELMGFDKQMYEQDTINPQYVRNYISDKSNYENIFKLTQNRGNKPLFVFNVTMQNHSGYKSPWSNLEKTVSLVGDMKNLYPEADQFFSLMRASDNALKELIEYYSNTDVKTMIVFFGDHQPPLPNSFYEHIEGVEMNKRTTEQILRQHTTPFFIWANYDIQELQNIFISSWGLNTLLAKTAGIELTKYQQFIYSVMQKIPVITPSGCITSNGIAMTIENLKNSQNYKNIYKNYQYAIYNNLFDKNNRLNNLFFNSTK